jgi:hypothetical protein
MLVKAMVDVPVLKGTTKHLHTAQLCNSSYRNNTATSLLDQDGEQTPSAD